MALAGKVVLVTGGGSGIGLGIAKALAAEGAKVAIVGRNEQRLIEAAALIPGGTQWHTCDVADRNSVAETFRWLGETLGPIDILVNSAGINIVRRSMEAMNPDDWDRVIAVNLTGAYNCIREALAVMRPRRDGLIVNISSIAGKRALKLAGVAYCASKFGMTALGTITGLEEHDRGIRVTNVYPGEVNTPILDQRPEPVPEERKAVMLQPEDVAALVVTIAKLPPRAHVAEVVVTPTYQEYA
ncbi:SDR family NAD(P)-dependent oxidoreductase [Thermostilla marina]